MLQVTTNMLWTLYCLARNPDVQQSVYRDTVAVLADSNGHVNADALQKLQYIKACVKETFRFFHCIQITARSFRQLR